MPVAKLTASATPNFMKPEVGNDSLDTLIRQAVGKEPFLSFPRAGGDRPAQWIQLFHALEQQQGIAIIRNFGNIILFELNISRVLECISHVISLN